MRAKIPNTDISSSQKTRLNDLSYGIKNLERLFFRFVTIYAFERRTDRRTDGQFSSLDRVCILCSAVTTRNSSGDEIANVNVLCDDIHALKYNRLLHKFRHRSISATQVYQIQ